MRAAGDGAIAVRVDHRDDAATAALFARVAGECSALDPLVNNAATLHHALNDPKPFWEKVLELGDILGCPGTWWCDEGHACEAIASHWP